MGIQVIIGVNSVVVKSGGEPFKRDSSKKTKKYLVDLIDIAIWNEYGTKTAPPRPAFRMGVEIAIKENKKNIEAYLQNVFVLSMQPNVAQKKLDFLLHGILKRLAQSAVKEVKKIIKEGSTVTNAPATIKKKGFNWPLYHKGLFLDNVNYEIEGMKS